MNNSDEHSDDPHGYPGNNANGHVDDDDDDSSTTSSIDDIGQSSIHPPSIGTTTSSTADEHDDNDDGDDDGSLHSSSSANSSESVTSDHAQDYYQSNYSSGSSDVVVVGHDRIQQEQQQAVCSTDGSEHGNDDAGHGYSAATNDDNDDSDDDAASSIHSLQSCEVIAAYTHKHQPSNNRNIMAVTTEMTPISSSVIVGASSPSSSNNNIDHHYQSHSPSSYYSEEDDEEDGGDESNDGDGGYYSSMQNDDYDDDDDDDSLGFPPGHITRLDELNELQNSTSLRISSNTNNTSNTNNNKKSSSSNVNPSIIPSYFFCPISQTIMKDPVITPDGHTYERRSILRSLILQEVDPMSNNPLCHTDLVDDYLIKQAIDKARKEAWIRYVVEFKDDDVDRIIIGEHHDEYYGGEGVISDSRGSIKAKKTKEEEEEEVTTDDDNEYKEILIQYNETHSPELRAAVVPESSSPSSQRKSPPSPIQAADSIIPSSADHLSPLSTTTGESSASIDPTAGQNHGWSVPLGVHKVICASPGLVVTTDVHRRSNVVKRKIIKKSLVEDANTTVNGSGKTKKSPKKIKMKRSKNKKKKKYKNLKTTTSVITRNLTLPPGSHVEVLETRVHGGRVRGRIIWEEEVATEMDRELALLLEEEEVRKRAMARPAAPRRLTSRGSGVQQHQQQQHVPDSPKKNKARMFFRKSSNNHVPFTSELFVDNRPLGNTNKHQQPSRSPSPPLTTIKYNGWISLQWAGGNINNNNEREEASMRRRSARNDPKAILVADEDDGPWTQPLPLGVYRIVSGHRGNGSNKQHDNHDAVRSGSSVKQLPLYDAPDSDSNIIDFLVCNQCLEIVETQLLVMKRSRDHNDQHHHNQQTHQQQQQQHHHQLSGINTALLSNNNSSSTEGQRVVRARCMVPVIIAPLSAENFVRGGDEFATALPQRKFRCGWITLSEEQGADCEKKSTAVTAVPIPIGAYTVTTNDPLLSCDANANIKSILPSGSCMEVNATRIEFQDKETMMKCHSCNRESMYHSVAVRALISSGGYVTLLAVSVGVSGTHGSLCTCGQLVQQSYAKPVPLGTYRITHPTLLTQGVGYSTKVMTELKEGARVRVIETRVEDGCVRGRVVVALFGSNNGAKDDNSSRRKESVTGWANLFQPSSFRWAEFIPEKASF